MGVESEDLDDDEVESSVSQELYLRKKHVDLITAVASGFSPDPSAIGSNSEFIFDSTDPLSYRFSNGADVLLARNELRRIHLCLVLCEVGDDLAKWVHNVNRTYDMFNKAENQEMIKDQLDFPDKDTGEIQYILLSRPDDLDSLPISDIAERITPDKFAIWSGTTEGTSQMCHEYGSKIHQDLRDLAENCFDWASSENPIQYSVETHPIISLRRMILKLVRNKKLFEEDSHPLEFNKDEFREEYEKYLQVGCDGDRKETLIRNATAEIFELGEQIGILSENDTNTVRDYRIMFQGNTKDPFDAQEAAEEKYIQLAKEVRKRQLAFERTKNSFTSLQSDLEDFSTDDNNDEWPI